MSDSQLFCVYSQAPDIEPLTWWSAPGYDQARRKLLDLLDLVPAPYEPEGSTWWLTAGTLAHAGAASDAQRELTDNVRELGGLVRGLRASREGASTADLDRHLGDIEHLDDDRVPLLAMLVLRILRCEPRPELTLHIGREADLTGSCGPDAETFGRLWLADLTTSSWDIVRAFTADMARWSYEGPARTRYR